MIPSLEGWPTKAKEAPSPHQVRLAPLDTNPVFQNLRENLIPMFGQLKPENKSQLNQTVQCQKCLKQYNLIDYENKKTIFLINFCERTMWRNLVLRLSLGK